MLRLRGESDEGVHGVLYDSMDHLTAVLLAGGNELGELLHDAAQWPMGMERFQG